MRTDEETYVYIKFEPPFDAGIALEFQELRDLIASNPSLVVSDHGDSTPDKAKLELVTTLAVVGAITGVAGLVLQAISIWRENKPKYSITITENKDTFSVDNLSRKDYLDIVERLNQSKTQIYIQVSRQ
ncbi:MAG: hypothetical protein PVF83_14125 [Anaerolineales bacterium]|jgi:hypothetical protein